MPPIPCLSPLRKRIEKRRQERGRGLHANLLLFLGSQAPPLLSPFSLSSQKEGREEETGARGLTTARTRSLSLLSERGQRRGDRRRERGPHAKPPLFLRSGHPTSPFSLLSERGQRRGNRRRDGARMLVLRFSWAHGHPTQKKRRLSMRPPSLLLFLLSLSSQKEDREEEAGEGTGPAIFRFS